MNNKKTWGQKFELNYERTEEKNTIKTSWYYKLLILFTV